jgi:hypothetical protein
MRKNRESHVEEYVLKDAWRTLPSMMLEWCYECSATAATRWFSEAPAIDRPAPFGATPEYPLRPSPLARAATVPEQAV